MIKVILLFILGLVLICVGGDHLVDAAVVIARKLGIPQIVVGATIVSIGTTLPEVLVSTTAAFQGSTAICAGNAFGSIICNTALIAGMSQLLKPSPSVSRKTINWRLSLFLFFGFFLMIWGYLTGDYSRFVGIICLTGFVVYSILSIKLKGDDDENDEEVKGNIFLQFVILAVCAACLYFGANLLVDNGIVLAEWMGVPQRVIAVTFIAIGTSLPELVTSISSIIKGYGNVGIGNIIGANLLNMLLVIGIPATIMGIPLERSTVTVDIPVGIAVMLLLFVPILIKKRAYRWQGALLLLSYAAYCVMTFSKN